MAGTLRRTLSLVTGWLADRRVPRSLRAPLYRTYARFTGADLSETRPPLDAYPSLGAFFVRRLADGTRPVDAARASLVSPVDGTVQAVGAVGAGRVVQAKGRDYALRELLAGTGTELDLEGAPCWTLYLSPRDYHRIHAPEAGELVEARWVPGDRRSVRPSVLARLPVLATNERCVLRLETAHGPLLLVLVGALNVGRIRVVGVPPGGAPRLAAPRHLARGEELARFELGSTVVLLAPPGRAAPLPELEPGRAVRLGAPVGTWSTPPALTPDGASPPG